MSKERKHCGGVAKAWLGELAMEACPTLRADASERSLTLETQAVALRKALDEALTLVPSEDHWRWRKAAHEALAPDAGLAYSQRMAALEEVAAAVRAIHAEHGHVCACRICGKGRAALARLDALPARTGR